MATASTNPLEATIEKAVCDYAKSLGFMHRKMNGLGSRSWPDRMFLKNGRVLFIEFKRIGGRLSAGQDLMINELRRQKICVFVVDTIEKGKEIINEYQRKDR